MIRVGGPLMQNGFDPAFSEFEIQAVRSGDFRDSFLGDLDFLCVDIKRVACDVLQRKYGSISSADFASVGTTLFTAVIALACFSARVSAFSSIAPKRSRKANC